MWPARDFNSAPASHTVIDPSSDLSARDKNGAARASAPSASPGGGTSSPLSWRRRKVGALAITSPSAAEIA